MGHKPLRPRSVKRSPARFWVQSTRVRRDFPRRGINPAHPVFSIRLSPVWYFPGPNLPKPTWKKSSTSTPWKESPSEALVSSLPSEATEAEAEGTSGQRRRNLPGGGGRPPASTSHHEARWNPPSDCPIFPATPLPRPEP